MKTKNKRGRHAERPSDIPTTGWKDILLRTKDELSADNVSVVSAGVAFFGLLALFPAIAAVILIAGLMADPMVVEQQIESFAAGLPENAAEILQNQARKVAAGASTTLGWAALGSILFALYGASKGMKTLMVGMNVAYDEDETRGFFSLNATALVLTILLVIVLILAMGLMIVLPIAADRLGLPSFLQTIIFYGRWILLALTAFAGFSILYRYGPSRDAPEWRWVTPGSFAAVVVWVLASIGFAFYVRNFGSYNETYGALGGVIVLLTWLWVSSYIVLLGAEIDSEIEHQTRLDTTVGPSERMGNRDAVKADTVGEQKS
ncbi:YihY/virulence factor BrkB family protein [Qipengyuania atrilutea]|uniref:YihY/virulence factor BrkB family protein n=1 Tax=Qipengyuania atrilutea TaxID=2744473 RepID=A0A850H0C1_9SPHN|nr:YihY/virulence factor BrkB family protein [Actirhodobacter atriluteus]NVD45384.1 YihY/virulence factor BrkB family protein [Actirhodobacter atriluteus]